MCGNFPVFSGIFPFDMCTPRTARSKEGVSSDLSPGDTKKGKVWAVFLNVNLCFKSEKL